MNKIIYNYKFHVLDVLDGRTFKGALDLGFRTYKQTNFQLSGIDLPDVSRIKDAKKKKEAQEYNKKAKAGLESILLYSNREPQQPHGRTIILSPDSPNHYGKSMTNAYVPCHNEMFGYPALTRRVSGYVLLNVVRYLKFLSQFEFDLNESHKILKELTPFDFNK